MAVASFSGCSGGGGEASPSVPVQSVSNFPLLTAIAGYINSTRSYQTSMTGTAFASTIPNTPFSGSGTFSESSKSWIFEGVQGIAKSSSLTATLQLAGQNMPFADTNVTYFDSNYKALGSTSATSYCVVTSSNPMPTTAKIGDNGVWYVSTCYTDSTKKTKVGTGTASYALEPDTQTTAILKLIVKAVDNGGNTVVTGSSSLRITVNGDVSRFAETATLTAAGITLNYTATYQ